MTDAPKGRVNLEQAAVLLLAGASSMELLTRVFQGFGVRQPARCADRFQAMELCQDQPFDLIVCDGALPQGEAYDFVAELRRSDLEPNRFAPVMLVQGHTPRDQVQKALDCGANFVVAKPVTPRTLLERILWIAQEQRPFIELDGYVGPDRRHKDVGPPGGPGAGRRKGDNAADLRAAAPRVDRKASML